MLKHQRLRPNRQHVLAAGLIEPRAQLTPAAIVVITEHRRPRNPPATSALDQVTRELDLRLEHNLVRDLRLAPPLCVLAPPLRQIQRPPKRHRAGLPDRVHRHPDLTVADLPQRARVLALDTGRVLAVLRKPGVIQHPRLNTDHRRDPLSDRLYDPRRIPRTIRQKLLHRLIVSILAQPQDQPLKRFTRPALDQPPHIQAAVADLHRTVHRFRKHLARERLQPLPHHRRRSTSRSTREPATVTTTIMTSSRSAATAKRIRRK